MIFFFFCVGIVLMILESPKLYDDKYKIKYHTCVNKRAPLLLLLLFFK